MSSARMPTLRIIDIPAVGTVIKRIRGGWGWLHRDATGSLCGVPLPVGQDGEPVSLATETGARCWLLAYHFQLGMPVVGGRQGGDAA